MELNEVFGQFMNSSEYSHIRVEAYKMSRDFYLKLLNSDLRKSFYRGGLSFTINKGEACEIMLNGYPIILTREFKEIYAFEEILYVSFEEEYKDIIDKA